MTALFTRPDILLHPNIVKPLHGVNPREIFGQEWWDVQRREAYAKNSYCCWACGVHKYNALFHPWLEAHETYKIDYAKGIAEMIEIVALCHACHNFIHSGRVLMMVLQGNPEMPEKKAWIIYHRGFSVLKAAGLKPNPFALFACDELAENGGSPPNWATSQQFLDALIDNPIPDGPMADWEKWRLVIDGKPYPPKYSTQVAWLDHFQPEWRERRDDIGDGDLDDNWGDRD